MWTAIFGDVVIVLGGVGLAGLAIGQLHLVPPDRRGWAALLAFGLAWSLVLEWGAQALDLWGYSDYMPTLTVFGHTVGLSPVVQVTMLPALSIYLAARYPAAFSLLHRARDRT